MNIHPGCATRSPVSARFILLIAALALLAVAAPGSRGSPPAAGAEHGEIWILVDTNDLTLSVMRGATTITTYENIAIGSNGVTLDKRQGDERTPLGDFRINEVRTSKRFHLFLSLDYPTMIQAERALGQGYLSRADFNALREAWDGGAPPPQDTNLGGHLGIHGLGSGSLEVHQRFNWTNGCIALTNEQVAQLAEVARIGTRVQIR